MSISMTPLLWRSAWLCFLSKSVSFRRPPGPPTYWVAFKPILFADKLIVSDFIAASISAFPKLPVILEPALTTEEYPLLDCITVELEVGGALLIETEPPHLKVRLALLYNLEAITVRLS